MDDLAVAIELPRGLDDVDARFMTNLLRARGVIADSNAVSSMVESDVGMTAGYFSAIKRVQCTFAEPTNAASPTSSKRGRTSRSCPRRR